MLRMQNLSADWRAALKIAVLFLVASSAWIVGSDAIAVRFAPTHELLTSFQTYKGLIYTAVMGLLVFIAAKSSFRREREVASALRVSETRLHAIFEHRYQLTGLLDPQGRLIAANRTALDFAGVEEKDVIGRFFWEGPWWDPAQIPEVKDMVLRASQGEHVRLRTSHLDKSGSRRHFDFSLTSVKDEDGNVIYLVPEGHDVTESIRIHEELNRLNSELEQRIRDRTKELTEANESLQRKHAEQKETEAELKRYATRLKQSNADLQQFAYIASHDLQEPLRAIGGFSELLERRYAGQLDETADTWIRFIVQGSQRMHRLIEDLLNYSRLDYQSTDLCRVDCNDILDEVAENLHTQIVESDTRLTRDSLPTITADKSQLARLLQNLVSNAIKFRGEVRPAVHVTAVKDGQEWLFRVRDNGIGIEQEYQQSVFEVFRRLHSRDDYDGNGVGLAVCRKIVLRHGGKIWVESEGTGQGTCVCFTIPAVTAPTDESS